MTESIPNDLFCALDVVVMERLDDGSFQVVGTAPEWFRQLYPDMILRGTGSTPGPKSLFLENFLIDAENLWKTDNTGRLRSGLWSETDSAGTDYALEAIAVSSGKRKFLLIELASHCYQEKQAVMQTGRQLRLDYHDLKRLEKQLRETQAALERQVEERTLLAQRVVEQTKELRIANAELTLTARAKDEFLAAMSHELRTPLNIILGMTELLQDQTYGPLTEQQLEFLNDIEESGRHLLVMINNILDISKIEAGNFKLEIGPMLVESVCQASLNLIKRAAHEKRLKISSNLGDKEKIIQADAHRLKQILLNLLTNAIKFTPEGGTIGLDVTCDQEKNTIHFTVWDTGIGIARKDMKKLFHPFVQLDSSLSRQHTGTGLGLALVKRLTEMHGGSVSIESEVGQGSYFTISLPSHS